MESVSDVSMVVSEYRDLFGDAETSDATIRTLLINKADWSPSAADHLHRLAKKYGSFMLRNALAVAIALEIEEGSIGF